MSVICSSTILSMPPNIQVQLSPGYYLDTCCFLPYTLYFEQIHIHRSLLNPFSTSDSSSVIVCISDIARYYMYTFWGLEILSKLKFNCHFLPPHHLRVFHVWNRLGFFATTSFTGDSFPGMKQQQIIRWSQLWVQVYCLCLRLKNFIIFKLKNL